MEAKLFNKIGVELKQNPADGSEWILVKPIVIQPKSFIGNLKIKLPKSIDSLLNKQMKIKYLTWKKPKDITVKIPIEAPKLFAKTEKYLQLDEVSVIIKTDKKILQ